MEYFINEGNKLGYLPTTFGATGNSMVEKKLIAGADILKGQVVVLSDELTVVPSSEPSKFVLGVAMFDAEKDAPVSVETEGLFWMTATAAITAPAEVEASTAGGVVTAGGTPVKVIGIAMTDAATDGLTCVKFSI